MWFRGGVSAVSLPVSAGGRFLHPPASGTFETVSLLCSLFGTPNPYKVVAAHGHKSTGFI